jgi:hypothetical protein
MTKSSSKSTRGFASMSKEDVRKYAAKGGREAHQRGTAHKFTPAEARAAGKRSHKKD